MAYRLVSRSRAGLINGGARDPLPLPPPEKGSTIERDAAAARLVGVGAQLAGRLARLDLRGPRDVLLTLPLRYEGDETPADADFGCAPGFPAQAEGEVLGSGVALRPRRQLVARIADDSGTLVARWFNFYPSQQKPLAPGGRVRLFGEMAASSGLEMVHRAPRAVAPARRCPMRSPRFYPTTAGVGQITLRSAGRKALCRASCSTTLPAAHCTVWALVSLRPCMLHHPAPDADLAPERKYEHPAWQRMKFAEDAAAAFAASACLRAVPRRRWYRRRAPC